MPAQTVKSALLAKIGQEGVKAWEQSKAEEVEWGIQQLPPGISGGVARLVKAHVGEYKDGDLKGKPFVLLQGTAVVPVEHRGVHVEGSFVMQTLPMCATPKRSVKDPVTGVRRPRTVADNMRDVCNELKKFLGDEITKYGPGDIPTILDALQRGKPYFRFSTRSWTPPRKPGAPPGDPPPEEMVFTRFDGVCKYVPSEQPPVTDTESDGEDIAHTTERGRLSGETNRATTTTNRIPAGTPVKPLQRGGVSKGAAKVQKVESEEDVSESVATDSEAETAFDEFGDIDSLVSRAEAGEQEAMDELANLANKQGIPDDDVDKAKSWQAVADMILGSGGEKAEDGDADEEPDGPAEDGEPEEAEEESVGFLVGQNVLYHPKDAKGRVSKKAVRCTVTALDDDSETASVRSMKDRTLYKGVPWGELEAEEEAE